LTFARPRAKAAERRGPRADENQEATVPFPSDADRPSPEPGAAAQSPASRAAAHTPAPRPGTATRGMRTLLVGMGRSGAGIHLPVLRDLRAPGDAPIVAVDCRTGAEIGGRHGEDVWLAPSLAAAARLTAPERTVAHVCTPPAGRADVVEELARFGFRRLLVEKPLAADEAGLIRLLGLRERYGLDIVVVAQWLSSRLTEQLAAAVRGGELGRLRTIHVVQRKPRLTRSQSGGGHPTAFDVEVPHSLGVVLSLAGPAEVIGAGGTDAVVDDRVLPRMGTAWLRLAHTSGTVTRIRTDLTAPVRERRITLELDRGTLIGYYPCSEADAYAQLVTINAEGESRSFLRDDSLHAFVRAAYAHFAAASAGPSRRAHPDLALNAEVVRVLDRAKRVAAEPQPLPQAQPAPLPPPAPLAPAPFTRDR
jgi:predicted dehydrogenase